MRSVQLVSWLIASEFVISTVAALAFGFRTTLPLEFLPQLWCLGLVACGPLARHIDHPRLAGATETVGLLYGQGMALYALLYPLTVIAAPWADARLAAADHAIGFNWPAFAWFVAAHPSILSILIAAYFSFMVQGAILLPILFAFGLGDRAWRLIVASNLALLACELVYPFTPAVGPFIHYGIGPSDYPWIPLGVPWGFVRVIDAVRDHGVRLIDETMFTSFVTFPSYHASAALLFAWAAWPVRWLRWPFVILNVAMAVSALIVGGHYLIDIIAGAAVAIAAVLTTKKPYANWLGRYSKSLLPEWRGNYAGRAGAIEVRGD